MKLVFAHFITPIPNHLLANIKRTREYFPDAEIVLITDIEIASNELGVEVFPFSGASETYFLKDELSHPMEFRNQFWLTTLLRVFAVCEYASLINDSVLHIESDVIISKFFPIDKFESIEHEVAYPIVSPGFGVASTLFIRDREAALNLTNFVSSTVSSDSTTTDMKVLYEYFTAYPKRVMVLPTGIDVPGIFQNLETPVTPTTLTEGIAYFKGIFDTVDIGFFLIGEDPRNHRGFMRLRTLDRSSFINIRYLYFLFDKNSNFLSVWNPVQSHSLPIYSLHIHSKSLNVIEVKSSPRVLRSAVKSQFLPPSSKFNMQIFLEMSFQYLKKRLRRRN
jgi:hypothetical protein